jgi:hypothetical protein
MLMIVIFLLTAFLTMYLILIKFTLRGRCVRVQPRQPAGFRRPGPLQMKATPQEDFNIS